MRTTSPGIQAIANIDPDLAPRTRFAGIGLDYEYRFHGTVSLLAGLALLEGTVHGLVRERHARHEFVEFLQLVHAHYPAGMTIYIILDNHPIHSSKDPMRYLATLPKGRFQFIFIKLALQALGYLRVRSKQELIARIEQWLQEINQEPVVFRWKWNLHDIENAFR